MHPKPRRLLSLAIASLLGVIALGLGPTSASAAGTFAIGDLATYSQPGFLGHEEPENTPTTCKRLQMDMKFGQGVKSAENFNPNVIVNFYNAADCPDTALVGVAPAATAAGPGVAPSIANATWYETDPSS